MGDVAIGRPGEGEYDPWYAGYVARVRGDDPLGALAAQREEIASLAGTIDAALAGHRWAPGKWTVAEVLGHLVDSERVFGTRALRIARGDATPQPGFDQDAYVTEGRFGQRTVEDLVAELEALRRANLALFRGLDAERWCRRGPANGVPVSVRALAFILVGHAAHHLSQLQERYLPTV